ncbi:olfactory receptor 11L1-like [Spea bombifrons]|uniref:olfactory receptor 11L1-like n=1 Tax=Spea bombifrons TaxID=233779 RepID=UPI0023490223|nr:olfactory receptor 11L1-like [Spea bombifrons]
MENTTTVTDFFLLGFEGLQRCKFVLFVLVLMIYVGTVVGNLVIIALISLSHFFNSPMYFFLRHLSFCDIMFTTNIVPNMLRVILEEGSKISIPGCVAQYHIFGFSASTESFLLTVMSFDRYLAICNPLHYNAIMDLKLQFYLVTSSWMLSLMVTIVSLVLICMLHFCGPDVINHFFCDVAPLIDLSCSDTSMLEMEIYVSSVPIVLLPFLFITGTYISIFVAIMRIPSTTGRQKAFSTCSSHLIVVCMYFGTLFAVYVVPIRETSREVNKILSLLYTVVTPFFNPIIYSLRNQDIRVVLEKHICRRNINDK